MIGSASAWRSYGFTQGSMLPQPVSTTASAASAQARHTFRSALTANRQPLTASISSLLQQRPNLIQILAFVAGLVAAVQVANVALAVDEHRARHGAHVVHLADLAVAIEHHRERHRRLAQPLLGVLAVGIDVDADQREAERTVALVHLVE